MCKILKILLQPINHNKQKNNLIVYMSKFLVKDILKKNLSYQLFMKNIKILTKKINLKVISLKKKIHKS